MRKLILKEVAPAFVIAGESYLVQTKDDEFVYAISGADNYWRCDDMPDISESEVKAIFEAPRENKIFAD